MEKGTSPLGEEEEGEFVLTGELMDVAAQLLDLCVLNLVEGGLLLVAQAPL